MMIFKNILIFFSFRITIKQIEGWEMVGGVRVPRG